MIKYKGGDLFWLLGFVIAFVMTVHLNNYKAGFWLMTFIAVVTMFMVGVSQENKVTKK